MKLNEKISIEGNKVILVPYEKYHVNKYHKWMQNEDLLKLTASERLTLNEEYEMQKSWREDEDKCTFIVLDATIYHSTSNEIESMIGDINLFINQEFPDSAEISLMIAESPARRKGFGRETLNIMLLYGIQELNIRKFYAKISQENESSIVFFKQNGFHTFEENSVFQECTMEKIVDNTFMEHLRSNLKFNVKEYLPMVQDSINCPINL